MIAQDFRTKICKGVEVICHPINKNGEVHSKTYSNRTQAQKMADDLNTEQHTDEWKVYQWSRPFYVGRQVKGDMQ